MKHYSFLLILFMALCLSLGNGNKAQAGSLQTKGVWVSCFEFEELGLKDKTEAQFRANANKIFATIRANGCNTVYFHVRAYDDAIYPSSVAGFSKYISSDGKAPGYDPLKILVSLAHSHKLKIHAWMNPYRVSSTKILDPASETTTVRIVNQVKEIINRYAVDGIHFDDYFYPTNIKKYKKVPAATRRQNVNVMVRKVYQTVKQKKKSLKFGISPAGDITYCEKIGADVRTWLSQSGYVDYIIPQIYWSNNYIMSGKKTALFNERLAKWRQINKRDVPMYVGLALYKTGYSLKPKHGSVRTCGRRHAIRADGPGLFCSGKGLSQGGGPGAPVPAGAGISASRHHDLQRLRQFHPPVPVTGRGGALWVPVTFIGLNTALPVRCARGAFSRPALSPSFPPPPFPTPSLWACRW